MPSWSGYALLVFVAATAALGIGYGISQHTASKRRAKRPRNTGAPVARLRLVYLKKVQRELESDIRQLEGSVNFTAENNQNLDLTFQRVDNNRHIGRTLERCLDVQCVSPTGSIGICRQSLPEFDHSKSERVLSYGVVSLSTLPLDRSLQEECMVGEDVKLEMSVAEHSRLEDEEGDFEFSEALIEEVQPFNLQIKINEGLNISADSREFELHEKRNRQLFEETARLQRVKEHLGKEIVTRQKRIKEYEEQSKQKVQLVEDVEKLEVKKKRLEDQLKTLSNSLRKESRRRASLSLKKVATRPSPLTRPRSLVDQMNHIRKNTLIKAEGRRSILLSPHKMISPNSAASLSSKSMDNGNQQPSDKKDDLEDVGDLKEPEGRESFFSRRRNSDPISAVEVKSDDESEEDSYLSKSQLGTPGHAKIRSAPVLPTNSSDWDVTQVFLL